MRNLSFSVQAGFNYRLHDYFQLVYMEWKFQLGLLKPWGNFSSVYRDEIFTYNRNSIFALLSLNMWDEISSRFNELKFQPRLKFSTIKSARKMKLFAKIIINVCKRLHLRCLTGFWMCQCCVRDNYLSVNFLTQLFLLLCGDSKLFRFSIKLIPPAHWQ